MYSYFRTGHLRILPVDSPYITRTSHRVDAPLRHLPYLNQLGKNKKKQKISGKNKLMERYKKGTNSPKIVYILLKQQPYNLEVSKSVFKTIYRNKSTHTSVVYNLQSVVFPLWSINCGLWTLVYGLSSSV